MPTVPQKLQFVQPTAIGAESEEPGMFRSYCVLINGPKFARLKEYESLDGGSDGSDGNDEMVGAMLKEKFELSYAVP